MDSTQSSVGFAATCSSNPDARAGENFAPPLGVPHRAGRDGLLRLAFERSGNATVLRRCRYTLPLQVLAPHALDDGSLYLLLLNPTGGVLGGDRLRTEIALGEAAHACLSTPSATRIYRTVGSAAEMETIIRLAPRSTLEYLPDPVVPHAGSSLRQTLRIEMDEASRAIFFDSFASGRAALGEHFAFRDFDSRTELLVGNKLLFLNRTKLDGTRTAHAAITADHKSLLTTEFRYFGSLLLAAGDFDAWPNLVASLRAELDAIPNVYAGASPLAHSGCSVRFLARSAIDFSAATLRLWTAARRLLLDLPPFSLRKY